jgi:hypothetical protein
MVIGFLLWVWIILGPIVGILWLEKKLGGISLVGMPKLG